MTRRLRRSSPHRRSCPYFDAVRAYFRVAPHFGVSMPWWVAIFAVTLWAIGALFYWLCVLTASLMALAMRQGQRAWRARRANR
jgi:hypothetical protein